MNKKYFSLGLMSGTSGDGVDASIIESDGIDQIKGLSNNYHPYTSYLSDEIHRIKEKIKNSNDLIRFSDEIEFLSGKLTDFHASVANKWFENIKVDIIGFHGQTILHKPQKGYSIQIGDSKLLSRLTKTKVISNFRENDIINGGQGAPLTPLYHKAMLSKTKLRFPLAIINIGGISNITYFKNKNKIISFDTGPGNYLLDK